MQSDQRLERLSRDIQDATRRVKMVQRAGYVLAMAVLQSDLYENGDEELRRAVRFFTEQGVVWPNEEGK